MGRKKTRVFSDAGSSEIENDTGSGFFAGSFLSCCIGTGGFVNTGSALIFLADFFDEAAGHKVLKFFIGTEAKHFFSTAHRIAEFEVLENTLEEIVESKYFLFG